MNIGMGLLGVVARGAEAGFGTNSEIIKNDIKRRQDEADDLRKRNLNRIEQMRQEDVKIKADKDTAEQQNNWKVDAAKTAVTAQQDAAEADVEARQNTAKKLAETNADAAAKLAETNAAKPIQGVNEIDGELYIGFWTGDKFTPQRKASPPEVEEYKQGKPDSVSTVTDNTGQVTIFNSKGKIIKQMPGIGKTSTEKTTPDSEKRVSSIRNDLAKRLNELDGGSPTQAQAVVIRQIAAELGLGYGPVKVKDGKGREREEWQLVELTQGKGHVETPEEEFNRKLGEYKAKAKDKKKEEKGLLETKETPKIDPLLTQNKIDSDKERAAREASANAFNSNIGKWWGSKLPAPGQSVVIGKGSQRGF